MRILADVAVMRSALLSRAALVLVVALAAAAKLLPAYDSSMSFWDSSKLAGECTDNTCDNGILGNAMLKYLEPLSRWDSIFFVTIAKIGYAHENFHAFFPFLPFAIRYFSKILGLIIPAKIIGGHALVLLSGILFTNACYVVSSVFLYKLTLAVFGKDKKDFAKKTVSLYLITPANIFMSAIYTESPFALFVFSGCYFLEKKNYWVSTIIFSLSAMTRGNGIICCGFLLFEAVNRFFPFALKFRPSNEAKFKTMIIHWVLTVVRILIICTPYVFVQKTGAGTFCPVYKKQHQLDPTVVIPEFCQKESFIPGHYGYIQSQYWNQGFLHYFQIKQIPNFILASPMAIISYSGVIAFCISYLRFNYPELFSFLPTFIAKKSSDTTFTSSSKALVYVGYWGFLLVFCTFCMHVQVMTRFLATTPTVYWFLASLFEKRKNVNSGSTFWVLVYCIVFTFTGILLFSGFYPWT